MSIFKKENKLIIHNNDKYELLATVKVTDVKGYLQDEYVRAENREITIKKLESTIEDLEKVKIKYEALLVVQEKTKERTARLDNDILELKDKLRKKNDELKLSNSKQIDIKINAENKLKEKDEIILELKKQIKELTPKKRRNKE